MAVPQTHGSAPHCTRSPVSRLAHAFLDDIVTTLFPADCALCHQPLVRAGLTPVCDSCLDNPTVQTFALCFRCGEAIGEAVGMESERFARQFTAPDALLCTECRLVPPPYERAVAFGVYADELRSLIHLLKYDHMPAVARPLGVRLAQIIATLHLTGEVTVVAVPLFPAKQRQRGYNQAVLLADHAIATLRGHGQGLNLKPGHDLLRRVRDTESQFALSSRQRRKNLAGAFEVTDAAAVAGRTVLLIDDIYTTGATARGCAQVLKKAGAARVYVATLSRAQTERAELFTSHTMESSVARWDAH